MVDNIQNGFGIREKWPLSGSSFPFFSAPEPNVAVFAIPLFQTEVGRYADERSWQNAQRKTLNAAKNTEHGYLGLAPLHIGYNGSIGSLKH